MIRRIIYSRPDGGLSVMQPVRNTMGEAEDITDAEIEQRAFDRLPADAIDPHFVSEAEVPTDRSYRDSWEADGATKIKHNMPKARDIHRDKMRAVRLPKLAVLDIDYQRADETGDTALKTEITSQKQALRDVTAVPEIEAAADIDDLKAAWPDVLV
jgi:hypothetical protein